MSGLRYNKGKRRWRNFPLYLMRPLVEVGAKAEIHEGNPSGKYPTLNFLNGLKVQDTLDSLYRHLDSFTDPNVPDYDAESECHHLAHVAWNALVALHYIQNQTEYDDRTLKYEEKRNGGKARKRVTKASRKLKRRHNRRGRPRLS